MQTKRTVFAGMCALLLFAGGMSRADEKAAVNLARNVKVGDTVRQKITVSASVNGMDVTVVEIAKTTAKEIDKKGNITWMQEVESSKINVGGNELDGPATPPVNQVRDKNNKLVEFKAPEAAQEIMSPEVQKITAMGAEIILSEKAATADDSWTTEFENPIVKDKKVTVKTTFLGVDKVDGKDYWKFKQIASAATDKDSKTTSEMTAWLNPETGTMFKMEASVKDVPTTQAGPISLTMKLETLKPEKTDKVGKAA